MPTDAVIFIFTALVLMLWLTIKDPFERNNAGAYGMSFGPMLDAFLYLLLIGGFSFLWIIYKFIFG